MRMVDIITEKKSGRELSEEQISFFVNGYTKGEIPDYQASAFAMAVCFRGMTSRETARLTLAMAESGDRIDLSCFGDLSADKHSTGGVGDKTTLIVAPIAAVLGACVAKMSGRGLGFTGGTVDKLEAIHGYRTQLTSEEFISQVQRCGICVVGQTGELAPADKKLYALRDVTGTIDSVPLIASSIMSKKIAAGAHSIVLDVKFGSGAFMKTKESAVKLAEEMVRIGRNLGRNMRAVISNMDVPLGRKIGNALEIEEAVEILQGKGDADLRDISVCLAAEMASLSLGISLDKATESAREAIFSGAAFKKMKEWVSLQGGDAAVFENTDLLPKSAFSQEVKSRQSGFLAHMDAEKIGRAAALLGAGRSRKDEKIDLEAGIVLLKKTGEKCDQGTPAALLLTNRAEKIREAEELYLSALSFSAEPPQKQKLIECIL